MSLLSALTNATNISVDDVGGATIYIRIKLSTGVSINLSTPAVWTQTVQVLAAVGIFGVI